ncbi:LuxR C-terminal-related transcriptional regulator [Pseudodesulfovibrio sp.]|nr:LuxR C-terminal-related transcriptional regulator [Pseudodesulfovibrio sp.]
MVDDQYYTLDSVIERLPKGLSVLAIESIQTPAGLFSRDFTVLWMNKAMGLIHRTKPRLAVGRSCHEVFNSCMTPCEDCCMTEVLETGRMVVSERQVDLPRVGRRWGDLYAYPIRSDDNEIDAIFFIAFDTTKHFLDKQQNQAAVLSTESNTLSPREVEVLHHIVEGYTNTQISKKLDISAHTVKTYVVGIFNKLGVSSRTLAAVKAVRLNLI